VTINSYKIIYELLDDVKAAMEGKLRTVEERVPVGTAEVSGQAGRGMCLPPAPAGPRALRRREAQNHPCSHPLAPLLLLGGLHRPPALLLGG
jgi:hypothetical protein